MTRYTINETAVYDKYVRWCGRTGLRGPSYPIGLLFEHPASLEGQLQRKLHQTRIIDRVIHHRHRGRRRMLDYQKIGGAFAVDPDNIGLRLMSVADRGDIA